VEKKRVVEGKKQEALGGFYTYPHHEQTATVHGYPIRCGAKIWGIRRFNHQLLSRATTVQKVMRQLSVLMRHPIDMECTDIDVYVIKPAQFCEYPIHSLYSLLTSSLCRIMPPGTWQEVYTQLRPCASGGHFLTYKTMHLTQWAWFMDHG